MENKTYSINISSRTILTLALISGLVLVLIKIKSIVLIILTSVVIASFISISAGSLKRRLGLNRSLAVALMYLITVAVFGLVFYFFVPVLIRELVNLIPLITEYFPESVSLEGFNFENVGALGQGGDTGAPIADMIEGIRILFNTVSSGVMSTLSALFGGIANVALVAIISFYLSISKDGIENFLKIVTPIQHEKYVIGLWERSQRKIAFWMRGQFVLAIIVGLLTFLGLSIVKMEYALLLAVIAGFFELIPFGVYLAVIPAITLSFAAGGLPLAILVVAVYVVIQQLESYLLSPLIVQKATGISPLVVILSVLIGINLAGFWGLILAIPVAVTILEYVKDLESAKAKELERMTEKQNV